MNLIIKYNNSKNLNLILKKNNINNYIYIFIFFKNKLINYINLGLNVKFLVNNKFFFIKQSFFLFVNLIKTFIFNYLNGYFKELNLKGIGYSIFILNKYLYIDLGYSHYIGIYINKNLILKRFKNKLVIYSKSKILVNNFIKLLEKFKKIDIYKGKGFILKTKVLKLKEGKKR